MLNEPKYKDSILWTIRGGDDDDPYVSRTDTLKIINNVTVLDELPDKFQRVFINGYVEIQSGDPTSTQFLVDYQNGKITFNESENGKTVVANYFGRGRVRIPAEMVYVHNEDPSIITSLQNIIDNGNSAIEANMTLAQTLIEVEQAITNSESATANANDAVSNVNTAISNAVTATTNANTATTAATTAATNASTAATSATNAASSANTAKTNADTATTNANNAASAANTAKTNADTAANNANAAKDAAQLVADNTAHKGDWSSVTAYKKNNIVTYNGSGYMAILDNTNNVPTNQTYWKLVSLKGDQGIQGIQGIKGDKGDQGIQGQAGISFVWKGVYSGSTAYAPNDVVSYNGSSYVCKLASTGNLPTNTTYWDLVAQRGTDGTGSGTVTSVTSANTDISVANTTSAPVLTLNSANSGANKILKLDTNGQTVATIILEDATHRWFTDTERTKLTGIAAGANNYTHPTGDGNLHVPVTGTTNNTKVLKAGSAAGSLSWAFVDWSELANKPTTFAPPIATSSVLGGVKQGSNVTIAGDGTISVAAPYSHPTGDGNLHVPATGTGNNGKYLKAGPSAGSFSWSLITFAELSSKPTTISGYGITDAIATSDNEISKLKKRSAFV